jgi:Ubiquitin carboxyl-terminal hydrolase
MGKGSSWEQHQDDDRRYRSSRSSSSPRPPSSSKTSRRDGFSGYDSDTSTRYYLRGGFQPQTIEVEPEPEAIHYNPKPAPKGFVNVGNSCYANAALQCLLSTALSTALMNPKSAAIFRRYSSNPNILAQGSGSVDSNEDVVKEKRRKEDRRMLENCRWLTRELRAITAEYNSPHTSWFSRPVVNPGNITRHPDRLSRCLRPYQQEDAHEFLRALLSTLVMNGQNRRLSSLFDGLLESAVTCLTCHRPSLTRDRYMDLSLDICGTHVSSLEDALEEFTKTEMLSGDNKVFCQKCAQKRAATKGLRLATAPSILVCHLKRFAFDPYGRLVRLDKKIDIPLILEITPYMSSLNKARPPPYELVAILVHQGQSCDSGHYLAYIKNNNQWYKCNDSVVEPVSVNTVLEQQAYMALYEVEEMRSSHTTTPSVAPNPWNGWKEFLQASCGVDESLLSDICWHNPPTVSPPRKRVPRTHPSNRSIESHCSHDDLSTLGESCTTVESNQPEAWRRISSSGNLKRWKEPLPIRHLPPRHNAHHRRNSSYWETRSSGGHTSNSTGRIGYSNPM